jgi:fatty-acyl-CoA synthase
MLSYARGIERELREQTVDQALKEAACQWADHEALVVRHSQKRFTFSQLDAEVERLARGLARLGLRTKDRVGVWASSGAEWILVQLACARIGAVLVNLNPAYRTHDLRYIQKKSRIKALFLNAKDSRADYRMILSEACGAQKLELAHIVFFGENLWEDLLAGGARMPDVSVQPTDVVNIQYTSGTTGNAKGVLLTHRMF